LWTDRIGTGIALVKAVRSRVLTFAKWAVGGGFALALSALVVVTWLVVFHAARTDKHFRRGQTIMDARKIASAVAMFLEHNPTCPTATDLYDANIISRKTRNRDAWDDDFRITCDGHTVKVRSAGGDRIFQHEGRHSRHGLGLRGMRDSEETAQVGVAADEGPPSFQRRARERGAAAP
jgi:hypothetical protein